MNSKKKSAVLGFTFFFILLQQICFAQTDFTYSPGTFGITLLPINTNYVPPAPIPHYTLFIETGNGRYFKKPELNEGLIDGTTNSNRNYSYPYSIATGSKAIVTISGWYDTTPRPPRILSRVAENPNGSHLPNQTNLPPAVFGKPQKRIAIDPCVDVIVPGDTMAVALTYKPTVSAGTNNLVAFFYNKSADGGNIFSTISGQTQYSFNGADNSTEQTKAVRVHNNEAIFTSLPQGVPSDVVAKLNTVGSAYSNAVYFFIDPNADETEKNIFFSLAPTTNSSSYISSSTDFFATIISYNSSGSAQQNTNAPLSIRSLARDPNWIKTTPHCFEGNEGIVDPGNVPITNQIKFTNDGSGDATDVIVTVTVPEGIRIPPLLTDAYVFVNGVLKVFKPWSITEKINYRISGRKIVFTMKGIALRGTRRERNQAHREGIITFKLRTNPAPAVIPNCMVTQASIVFFSIGTENKPITAWDIVRSSCSVSCISKVGPVHTQ